VLTALSAGLGTAALIDMRQRRIPNVVSACTAAAGLALAASGVSEVTLMGSLAGLAIGLVLMLPGHVLGALGAGDVKLFAAAGTLLGGGRMIPAFIFMAIAGGVLAVAVAWYRHRIGRTMLLTARLLARPGQLKAAVESKDEHNRFSYGPAIAIGCVLAALTR
jgi:prepilin peptidase CpaA